MLDPVIRVVRSTPESWTNLIGDGKARGKIGDNPWYVRHDELQSLAMLGFDGAFASGGVPAMPAV